jgi:hypothetical protein
VLTCVRVPKVILTMSTKNLWMFIFVLSSLRFNNKLIEFIILQINALLGTLERLQRQESAIFSLSLIRINGIKIYYSNYCDYAHYVQYRMIGIGGLSSYVRAWLQETCSLCHPHSKYPAKASCGFSLWHWDHTAPSAQHQSRPGAPGDSRQGAGDGLSCGLSTRGHWDCPKICNG